MNKTELLIEAIRYKQGFELLYQYFDSISEEEQIEVGNKLDELGL